MLAFFTGGIGWQEILLIMVVLLVFFGRRIPEVMRSLGQGVSQFKKGLSEVENEVKDMAEESSGEEPEEIVEPHPEADVSSLDSGGEEAEIETEADADAKKDSEELAG